MCSANRYPVADYPAIVLSPGGDRMQFHYLKRRELCQPANKPGKALFRQARPSLPTERMWPICRPI